MKLIFLSFLLIFSTSAFSQSISGEISIGGEYNYWSPLDLAAVEVNTEGFQVGFVELGFDLVGFSIPVLRYETNFGGSYQDEIIMLQEGEGEFAKYENLIGILDVSSFVVKYNKETYISDVSAINNFNYIDRRGRVEQFVVGQQASFSTQFESLFLGKDFGTTTGGVFYATYKKPYFFTDNELQDRSTLFFGEFKSFGIEGFGSASNEGLPFQLDYGFKFGLGDVDLGLVGAIDDTLNNGERVGYFELSLLPRWTKAFGKSTAFNLGIEAVYRYFYKATAGGTTTLGEDRGFNSDLTVKILASVMYRF
ncbi:MAG: hypothetical protein AB8B97_27315 [Granulosicoccus sp.]